MKTFTIGQLAKVVGVPTSTIRYYERRGLVEPELRSNGNYRLYTNDALDRLRFIRAAQGAGFTLGDITELLELRDDTKIPCDEVQSLIRARTVAINEKINQLQVVEGHLNGWLDVCRADQSSGCCSVIAGFETSQ